MFRTFCERRYGVSKLSDDIIKEIMEKVYSTLGKQFEDTVYRDEPIITTASRMPSYVPQEIGDMKKLALDPQCYGSTSKTFLAQAKFMANYEDDFDTYVRFERYFPTYASMDTKQLRCYFSWRTKLRRGIIEKVSLSYVFVYVYELLALIGTDGPADAFCKLKSVADTYGEYDPVLVGYINKWIEDFVVYYALSPSLLEGCASYDGAVSLSVLINPKGDDELFSALTTLSSYNIENSKLYKTNPEITKKVVCEVWRSFSENCVKKGQRPLVERLFGVMSNKLYVMFGNAVFFDVGKRENRVYTICDTLEYRRFNGVWYRKCYENAEKKNKKLGAILKYTDSVLREQLGFPALKVDGTKVLRDIVLNATDKVLCEKAEKEKREVKIDFSTLDGIRKSSAKTREALLTDEERFDALPFENMTVTSQNTVSEKESICENGKNKSEATQPAEKSVKQNPYSLSDAELCIVKAILNGENTDGVAREHGLIFSVAIEQIDEKLFDAVSDNVIYYDGEVPTAEEYYLDFLKGLIENEH